MNFHKLTPVDKIYILIYMLQMLNIALLSPQIPQNTGNIARLAVGLDISLILIGKLGFSLNDRYLKRAGLDYWDSLKLKVYDDFNGFLKAYSESRIIPATTKGINPYYDFKYAVNDVILFGSETHGLPVEYIKEHIKDSITIPMPGDVRSLNLSNSAAVIIYHSLLQLGYFNNFKVNRNYYDLPQ
jgi:tRNA (cytidine/uridine-2'-O-)-methyltransferase